jgi:uncharacterized protein YjdB
MNVQSVSVRLRFAVLAGVALSLLGCPDPDRCGGIAPSQRTVTVSPADLTLEVGGQSTVGAAVGGECVNGKTGVRYESSNPAIASVSSTGAVTALAAGSVNITATSTDYGVSGTVRVTVRPPAVQSLVLSAAAVTVRERKTAVLRVTVETTGQLTKRVRFTSSAPAVATVTVIDSLSATVTGVATGTADIEVVSEGDATKRATARITVDPALVATVVITGVAASDSVVLASARQLSATVSDSAGVALASRPVTWATGNPAVLTVSPTGEIQAVAAGTTQITATVPIGDGSGNRTATATVRVFGSLQIAVTPSTATVDEGQTVTLTATVSGTAGIARGVSWESSNIGRATVSSAGVVTGVLTGSGVVYVRARSQAVPTVVDSSAITVLARAVPTTIDARPNVDTLSPLGTRTLSATVRDQRNNTVAGAPIVWRSLTPSLASVSASGVVTAIANGTALISAASPRSTPADSLRDTTSVLIVAPCTLVRPIQFGSTYNGAFDASSCRNFIGFPSLDQFSLTSTTQRSYAIRLVPTFVASLVPLTIGSGFYGISPTDTAVVGLGVMRPGTFGFFVASPSSATIGSYSFTVTENPNPALNCVTTDVTRGVSFDTALLPVTCQSREIRILPALGAGVTINITATAQAFPVQIELREFGTNTLLANAGAAATGLSAVISFANPSFRFAYLRVIGPNGTVRVVID